MVRPFVMSVRPGRRGPHASTRGHGARRRLALAASSLGVLLVAVAGCRGSASVLQDSLARVDSMHTPSEKLASLVDLDQVHPNTFGIKFRLGELYLSLGELE